MDDAITGLGGDGRGGGHTADEGPVKAASDSDGDDGGHRALEGAETDDHG